MIKTAIAAVAALALGAAGAHAGTNLLTNGGFETGDFTGWTQGGNTGFTGVVHSGLAGVSGPQSGAFYAALGPVGSDGTLTQAFADTNGQAYDFSFWFASDGGTPNDFSVAWDGATLAAATDTPSTGGAWQFVTFDVVGTGSDSIEFTFRNDPGYQGLDNVYVGVGAGAVPEPATWALMLAGFAGLGAALRSKRRDALA